ncbi:MAG: peptidoglycan DD-metalloendopeptidase family protein [Bacteroidetes bacterium]|nr:peptidoglycan DD-metalloendopeptidase family protein [Bacteroidota bacterium]
MDKHALLKNFISKHPGRIGKVVDFEPKTDKLFVFDFAATNTELSPDDAADTETFSHWVDKKLHNNHCRYGIGGYMEHRTLYARSEHFSTGGEPRRLHLGIDIWGAAGVPVYAPLAGIIHSFRDNNNFGDYGPTIILQHDLDGLELFSLYGHLSRNDLTGLHEGDAIVKGQRLGSFGCAEENGHWPPHLHFQLMFDIEGWHGDYPGVAKYSEKDKYLQNIPDPALILQFPPASFIK